MNKRPVTITVIAWIMIIGNGIALVDRLSGGTLLPRASELIQSSSSGAIPTSIHDFQLYAGWVISIVSWIFILRGANWARYLFIIWGAIDFIASFIVAASSFALFYPIVVIFLLRPKVSAYFTRSLLPASQQTCASNEMSNEKIGDPDVRRRKRPILITLLALLLMLSVLMSIDGFITPTRLVIYPDGILSLCGVIGIIYVILMLVSSFGYWLMKPWGVYIFAAYLILGFVQQYTIGNPVVLDRAMKEIVGSPVVATIGTAIYGAIYIISGYYYIIRHGNDEKKNV